MPVVRQLTTRFAFETDKRGIKNFQDTVGGMRRTLFALAGAFATGVTAKGIITSGAVLDKLAVDVGQFTDEIERLEDGTVRLTGNMARAFEKVTKAIPGTETMSDFLQGFVNFKQTFKEAGTLDQFERLFTISGLLAKITGTPLSDMFENLRQAQKSGDFDTFAELIPDFDSLDAATKKWILQLQSVDPTGAFNLKLRLVEVDKVIRAAIPGLTKTATEIEKTTAIGQWTTLKDNIRFVSEQMGLKLQKTIVSLLGATNAFFEEWRKGEGLIKAVVEGIKTSIQGLESALSKPQNIVDNLILGIRQLKGLLPPPKGLTPEQKEELRILRIETGGEVIDPNRKLIPTSPPRTPSGKTLFTTETTINVNAPITITGAAEAGQIARMVQDAMMEGLRKAFEEAGIAFPALEGMPTF